VAALSTWAAYVTTALEEYAPYSLVVAALFGGLLFLWLCQLGATAYLRLVTAQGRKFALQASDHQLNPLEKLFNKRRISPASLVMKYDPIVDARTFQDCQIVGPANVFFTGCNMGSFQFKGPVQFVEIVDRDAAEFPVNTIIFHNCTFVNCSFADLTVFVPSKIRGSFDSVPKEYWLTGINDG